jgi:hypothetical protein
MGVTLVVVVIPVVVLVVGIVGVVVLEGQQTKRRQGYPLQASRQGLT